VRAWAEECGRCEAALDLLDEIDVPEEVVGHIKAAAAAEDCAQHSRIAAGPPDRLYLSGESVRADALRVV